MNSLCRALRSKNRGLITSYMRLRQLIGHLGIFMPLLCFLFGLICGHWPLQDSISAYYYTNVRDLFVGILVCVGLFLVTYKGYELIDNIITTISGIASMGIAAFPCWAPEVVGQRVGLLQLDPSVSYIVHGVCALCFFILLAVNSLFLFTKTNPDKQMTEKKKQRNMVYVVCGVIILIALAGLVLSVIFGEKWGLSSFKLMFIFETVMLVAFGISWLVKGELILKDGKPDDGTRGT